MQETELMKTTHRMDFTFIAAAHLVLVIRDRHAGSRTKTEVLLCPGRGQEESISS